MGKAGKDRKRRRLLAEMTATGVGAQRHKADQENVANTADMDITGLPNSKDIGGVVSEEDMATTLRTLMALQQHTEVFRSKSCRALRATIHQLQQTATAHTGTGKSLHPQRVCNKQSQSLISHPDLHFCS